MPDDQFLPTDWANWHVYAKPITVVVIALLVLVLVRGYKRLRNGRRK